MCYYINMDNNAEIFEKIYNRLDGLIEVAESELVYSNPFELLVAVMLSAQCTDKRVNMVTSRLFEVYKTPEDFANLDIVELEKYISSCNYYHNKAKNIISASKQIVDKFGGVVPSDHKDLVSLSGVGNKTASVIEVVAFKKQAMPVDTHILRVSNRLGLCNTNSPDKCSLVLMDKFKGFDYGKVHHLLLLFGRYYCTARSPKCSDCVLKDICKLGKQGDR